MILDSNIAIDGYSSCGKSTIAKFIAQKYSMRYIDTGAMYRAITLFCMWNNIIRNKKVDLDMLHNTIMGVSIDFEFNSDLRKSETLLNNENVENIIRGYEVSDNVSIISQIQIVREKLVLLQKEIGKKGNVVMDGRDIGTVVFPDAKLKIFITARPEVRAKRRLDELLRKGEKITFKEVLLNLNTRDDHDTNRAINPLLQAKDAILLDNSDLTIIEQNNFIDKIINEKLLC